MALVRVKIPMMRGTTHRRAGVKIKAKRRLVIDVRTICATPLAGSMM